MRTLTFFVAAAVACLSYAGCSRCSSDGIDESKTQEGSTALSWEEIPLGTSQEAFKASLWKMGAFEESKRPEISCVDQTAISVLDDEKKRLEERGTSEKMFNCALMQVGTFGRSWNLASAKGEFLNGTLASLTFRFAASEKETILGQLAERFGQGTKVDLTDVSLLGVDSFPALLWKKDGELWALFEGRTGTVLMRQNMAALAKLTPPPSAPEPGKKVSLDDIGLGGGLDLNVDDLDDIPVPEPDEADAGKQDGSIR